MNSSTTTAARGTQVHLWVISNLVVVALLFALYELAIALLLRFPPPFEPILRVLSSYYTEHDRRIVQALPECAVYDPQLAYTLRPGGCRFSNRDFDIDIRVNSKGLRDTEERLRAPEVIALGDSVTMGWGVAAADSFPKRLERQCGIPVLNAGVSSYGTVREMRLLQRLDVSRLKTLLVQYSDNDVGENRHFLERGNAMKVMSETEFRAMQDKHAQKTGYVFGAHAVRFSGFLADKLGERLRPAAPAAAGPSGDAGESAADAQARFFLNALTQAGPVPPGVEIVVFEVNGRAKNGSAFAQALTRLLDSRPPNTERASIRVLDLSPLLTNENFFVLDDHPDSRGHARIAAELGRTLHCGGADSAVN